MTNTVLVVTNKLLVTAAYKYVALAMMLTNCNLFLQQTHLAKDAPMVFSNVILSECSVAPPRLMGFSGSVVTTNLFFGFGHDHLANFWQWEFHAGAGQSMKQQNEQWATMTSQVGTNEAHQLALNWLTGLGVDTATLEKKHPCKVTQKSFYPNAGNSEDSLEQAKRVALPIFQVQWGSISLHGRPEYSLPAVTMTVFGPTKELVEYHLFDDSLMLLPKLEIEDLEKLLNIPDEEFHQYDDLQRSNLVSQFTVNDHSQRQNR